MSEEFTHDRAKRQFEVTLDGVPAGVAHYRLAGTVAVFDHTVVPPPLEGRGIAGRLVRFAMDEIRAEGQWRVRPVCSYVVGWFARNPADADLLA